MLEQLWSFFIANLKSLFYGILLLIVALLFLPDQIVVWIVRKIKPSILQSEAKKRRDVFALIINILLYRNFTDFSHSSDLMEKLERVKQLHVNNSAIERNLYFLDLCVDTFNMLLFALPRARGDIDYGVFSEAINYLDNYTHYLTPFDQNHNFCANVSRSIGDLQHEFEELSSLHHRGGINKETEQLFFNNQFNRTRDYLANERKALERLVEQNKNELKSLMGEIISDRA